MALLESTKIPLGTKMSSFMLKDPDGNAVTSDNLYTGDSKGLLVAFTCNHCPYAVAVWPRLIQLAKHAQEKNILTIAINPNIHPDYPDDSPEKMKEKISQWGITFPYLVDESQDVAKAFKAQCTPDIYLFNANQELVYHGRIDDNWKDPDNVSQEELKDAINALASDEPISSDQKPAMGCSIKWKNR